MALGVLVGFVAGIAAGEPSIGVLVGTAAGVAAALILWLVDRRRD